MISRIQMKKLRLLASRAGTGSDSKAQVLPSLVYSTHQNTAGALGSAASPSVAFFFGSAPLGLSPWWGLRAGHGAGITTVP